VKSFVDDAPEPSNLHARAGIAGPKARRVAVMPAARSRISVQAAVPAPPVTSAAGATPQADSWVAPTADRSTITRWQLQPGLLQAAAMECSAAVAATPH